MIKTAIFSLCSCLILSFPSHSEDYQEQPEPFLFYKAVNQSDDCKPLAELEGEPSATIHGCVNVISGQVSVSGTDLTVYHGVNPLHYERSYGGATREGNLGYSWITNHCGFMNLNRWYDENNKCFISGKFYDDHGNGLNFKIDGVDKKKPLSNIPLNVKCLHTGIANTSMGCVCGQTNLKNVKLEMVDGIGFYITDGSGRKKLLQTHPDLRGVANYIVSDFFPSGNSYTYDRAVVNKKKNTVLRAINLINARQENRGYLTELVENKPFNPYFTTIPPWRKGVDISTFFNWNFDADLDDDVELYLKNPCPSDVGERMMTNDGRWVLYKFVERNKKGLKVLREIKRSDGPTEQFYYTNFDEDNQHHEHITSKFLPDNRYVQFTYYEMRQNKLRSGGMTFNDRFDPRLWRVKALHAPAGTDSTQVLIYEFDHQINIGTHKDYPQLRVPLNGYCDVTNALNHRVRYEYGQDQRLFAIYKFNTDGSLAGVDRLGWEPNSSKLVTCLRHRYLVVDGSIYFGREYDYDDAGNVLVDTLYGNLSGVGKIAPVMNEGRLRNSTCEKYQKFQEYSNDGFNLLLKETDGILTTHYVYEPQSNRISAKYVGTRDKILRRWFYKYNHDAAVIYECADDGSSRDIDDLADVTQRRMTYLTQSEVYPAAFPLVIEEKCLDLGSGQEMLIHKVTNTYTGLAKIKKQCHYDSNNDLQYTLEWEYDNMGNITKEINAIGQIITRKFDANGNQIEEIGPDPQFRKEFTYDFMNRLIKESEYHPDGTVLTTSHKYDLAGNRTATEDVYGNETAYSYDAFGRIIKIEYPSVYDENGNVIKPIVKKEYDPMGKVKKEIDAHGIEKTMTYTIRGQMVENNFPDGTCEQNIYNVNGTLNQIKSKNGTITKFEHDSFGRPIKTEIYDVDGDLLSVSTSDYIGYNLIRETDPMGVSTTYTYYPDGKMKSKSKGNRIYTFEYDTLRRLIKTIDSCCDETGDKVVKKLKYDLLDRVIEETTEDGNEVVLSKKCYEFDVYGNICEEKSYCQAGESIIRTTYDSHGTALSAKDPLGNEIVTRVCYDYVNSLGQRVPYSEVTDPMGMVTIKICDALGHVVEMIKKNSFGKIIQQQSNQYDAVGNLCLITDRVILPDDTMKDCITSLKYDTCRRLVACYEALGTPEQKQTIFEYLCGQKDKLIKSDGTIINYKYDALGRQSMTWSSDYTFDYEYTYDLNNNPLCVVDKINKTSTIRIYDCIGNLEKEILATGLTFDYTSDFMGRPTKITLPDASGIKYTYASAQLKAVSRLGKDENLLYSHNYDEYDLAGNVVKAKLVSDGGSFSYRYDLLNRLVKEETQFWSESIDHYDPVGNILELTLDDPLGKETSKYTYDDLYQLKTESGISDHIYTYDSHYNRRSKDGRHHEVNSLHQLIDDGIYTYTYDANGNMKTKTSTKEHLIFDYDALDRLVSIKKADQQYRYTYDENNRRLSKIVSQRDELGEWKETSKICYLYQGQNEIGSINEKGKIIELRLIGIGKGAEIGAAVAMELNESLYIPIHDHIGNVCCLLDGTTGEPVETYRYTSFGEELFDAALSPWRYASKRIDEESGFIYFGRRYYDASIGRWITPDPIGRDGGINLYAYVLNAPLTHFDLYGLFGMQDYVMSGLGHCMQKAAKFVSNLLKVPGHAIGMIGYHLVPIPYVKDAIEFCGHCLTGKNPSAFVPAWKRDRCQIVTHEGYGFGDPGKRHILYNGICTSLKDFNKQLADFSKSYGGITVYGVYNNSQGAALDLVETMCQKLGIPTRVQDYAQWATSQIRDSMGEYKETGTIVAQAHSQGAETVHNLSPDLRRRMEVNAIGPARILQHKDFKVAHNYINRFDIVPLADPIGLFNIGKSAGITYLPSCGCPYKDHRYESKTFREIRQREGYYFKSRFGEVL